MPTKKPTVKTEQVNDQAVQAAEQIAEPVLHAEPVAETLEVAASTEVIDSAPPIQFKAGDVVDSELLLFSSPVCGPCAQMKPVLDKLAKEHDLPLQIVSFEKGVNEHLFEQFGVRNVPALLRVDFVLQDDGKVIEKVGARNLGYNGEAHLSKLLETWGLLRK